MSVQFESTTTNARRCSESKETHVSSSWPEVQAFDPNTIVRERSWTNLFSTQLIIKYITDLSMRFQPGSKAWLIHIWHCRPLSAPNCCFRHLSGKWNQSKTCNSKIIQTEVSLYCYQSWNNINKHKQFFALEGLAVLFPVRQGREKQEWTVWFLTLRNLTANNVFLWVCSVKTYIHKPHC